MLPHWAIVFFTLLNEYWSARRSAQIQLLKLQIELLRQKLPGNRVILSLEDRSRLLRAGADMNHEINDVMCIVAVKTYRQWVRDLAAGKAAKRVGRPKRMTPFLRALIVRLAKENIGWGVRRIVGELRILGLIPSRSSIRRVLTDEGVLPEPNCRAPNGVVTQWRTIVSAHMDTMVACDFFCKSVWTPMCKKLAYVLVFIWFRWRGGQDCATRMARGIT